jgi:hypothetical protein
VNYLVKPWQTKEKTVTVYEALMRDGREKRARLEAAQAADKEARPAPAPLPAPAGFRTRYRSEPGMIGRYPWTYADQDRRRADRPQCEYENLYTADQVMAMLAAERERCAQWVDARRDAFVQDHGSIDPETCALEFGRGAHAEAKSEYVCELEDIASGLRTLGANGR